MNGGSDLAPAEALVHAVGAALLFDAVLLLVWALGWL